MVGTIIERDGAKYLAVGNVEEFLKAETARPVKCEEKGIIDYISHKANEVLASGKEEEMQSLVKSALLYYQTDFYPQCREKLISTLGQFVEFGRGLKATAIFKQNLSSSLENAKRSVSFDRKDYLVEPLNSLTAKLENKMN